MRWQATLECPRTRTWRPPHSSLRRALVLSTPDPHGLGIDMAYCTPGPGLPVPLLLEVLVPARIDIDDRHMAKPFVHLVTANSF